ncbi:Benzyl alcohol O-benzoyltransferase [Hibiscus syriacus]|uniref:Benzyl alcohol O-benzoyltransferase n=1 Tax=Hibiscus syriacus TaxID=106335 RepID=A0A6A2YZR6_HIBSY|nr:benzyl alcohol O-benzoyltransferase-like [Hibiscus syriacus]KAE8684709.1 Benzyl alcohol O-benzoyltransferase [Hibiscus syriacus]
MALLPLPLASPVFTVRRHKPELVVPARPTPRECLLLSDIDNQQGLRYQMPGVHFYRQNPSMEGKDPAQVIRKALAQALVFYYPFAGRLREAPNGKLMVDCNAQGVLFIEADVDVTFEDFGGAICPPFPCFEELLYDVPGSSGLVNCPLLLIQVTRLKCGGFIFAHRVNHTIVDAMGVSQLMHAMTEIAQGALTPSIPPVWERHLLSARDPPVITCVQHAYGDAPSVDANCDNVFSIDGLVHRSLFFGPTHISALWRFIPDNVRCSTFDILTACLWRCRTRAFRYNPDQDIRVILIVNARSKFNPPLPLGYYGNAIGYAAALTTAGKLCRNPVEYAVKLVKEAKATITEEYMKSMIDLLVIKDGPTLCPPLWLVSDLRRARIEEVDFGWGKEAHMAPAIMSEFLNFYIPYRDGVLVPVSLAAPVMEIFVKELDGLLNFKDEADSVC